MSHTDSKNLTDGLWQNDILFSERGVSKSVLQPVSRKKSMVLNINESSFGSELYGFISNMNITDPLAQSKIHKTELKAWGLRETKKKPAWLVKWESNQVQLGWGGTHMWVPD